MKGKKCRNESVEYNITCDRILDKYNIMRYYIEAMMPECAAVVLS